MNAPYLGIRSNMLHWSFIMLWPISTTRCAESVVVLIISTRRIQIRLSGAYRHGKQITDNFDYIWASIAAGKPIRTFVTGVDLDQPLHTRSLIWGSRMFPTLVVSYQRRFGPNLVVLYPAVWSFRTQSLVVSYPRAGPLVVSYPSILSGYALVA